MSDPKFEWRDIVRIKKPSRVRTEAEKVNWPTGQTGEVYTFHKYDGERVWYYWLIEYPDRVFRESELEYVSYRLDVQPRNEDRLVTQLRLMGGNRT